MADEDADALSLVVGRGSAYALLKAGVGDYIRFCEAIRNWTFAKWEFPADESRFSVADMRPA